MARRHLTQDVWHRAIPKSTLRPQQLQVTTLLLITMMIRLSKECLRCIISFTRLFSGKGKRSM